MGTSEDHSQRLWKAIGVSGRQAYNQRKERKPRQAKNKYKYKAYDIL
jgi:hypothetical protein